MNKPKSVTDYEFEYYDCRSVDNYIEESESVISELKKNVKKQTDLLVNIAKHHPLLVPEEYRTESKRRVVEGLEHLICKPDWDNIIKSVFEEEREYLLKKIMNKGRGFVSPDDVYKILDDIGNLYFEK